ncbi:hypothetical protein [Listeria monocytogenes]|uniref:hypothetical protein n=1 Tax=Listeria monocytogenes TaxID=1639 RepID=UPI0011EAFB96|nr:hypothetical protein [Listeria monocytogenes]EBF5150728.1 hypothetical protein [Listeria monocytogenes]TYV36186.1 hypothetical protein FZ060_07600 [Listeria monocytogenes]HAO6015818.1 hypothetical protein [Listeria monocytogenes]HBC0573718.1 hypothetical protein [Listeria monocytogenes]
MWKEKATKKHIGNNKGYYLLAFLIIVMLFLSFGGNYFFPDSRPINQDKLGTKQVLMTQIITLLDWEYDKGHSEMIVAFGKSTLENTAPIFQKITSFSGVSKESRRFKTKVIYNTDSIYVVSFSGVPKDFGQIYVSIQEKEITEEDAAYFSSSNFGEGEAVFYADYRRVKHTPKLEIKKEKEYVLLGINYQLSDVQQERLTLKKEIKNAEKDIYKMESTIKSLRDKQAYETKEEKEVSAGTITTMEQTIEQRKEKIKEIERIMASCEEKIKGLEQRKGVVLGT